jgi:hypothetical protein
VDANAPLILFVRLAGNPGPGAEKKIKGFLVLGLAAGWNVSTFYGHRYRVVNGIGKNSLIFYLLFFSDNVI